MEVGLGSVDKDCDGKMLSCRIDKIPHCGLGYKYGSKKLPDPVHQHTLSTDLSSRRIHTSMSRLASVGLLIVAVIITYTYVSTLNTST